MFLIAIVVVVLLWMMALVVIIPVVIGVALLCAIGMAIREQVVKRRKRKQDLDDIT